MTIDTDILRASNFSVDALLLRAQTLDEERRLQVSNGQLDEKLHRGVEALADFVFTAENCRAELVRLASQVLGSPEEADDVVQDALLAAFVSISEIPPESKVKAWVIELVLETALRASSSRAEGIFESFEAISRREKTERPLREIGPGIDAERHYELKEMGELVSAILEGMSDARRHAFEMCVLEKHRQREAAAFLAMSPSNVKALIFRTKRALRREISKLSNQRREQAILKDRCSQSLCGAESAAPTRPCITEMEHGIHRERTRQRPQVSGVARRSTLAGR